MKTGTMYYLLNETGRKDSIKKGGNGKMLQQLSFEVTNEILNLKYCKVDECGDVVCTIGFYVCESDIRKIITGEKTYLSDSSDGVTQNLQIEKYTWRDPQIEEKNKVKYFDKIMTLEELINWEKERVKFIEKRKAELEPEFNELLEEYNKKQEIKKAEEKQKEIERENELKARAEREMKKEEAKRLLEEDKEKWIKKYGSERLKKCLKLGYECQRIYVLERAEKEFPKYTLDWNASAEWNERVSPSMEALEEVEELLEKGYNAEIVWLTELPSNQLEEDELPELDECFETIIIREYLGKYTLVKVRD